jgi:ArsR family transcriptional regulator, arsenate/arsenite/antimonite-responsive transcriptional repressor
MGGATTELTGRVERRSEPLEAVVCCAPLSGSVLSEDEVRATAELFRALNVLATCGEPVCICHLVEPLELSQPTVSHHMKKLVDVGLVEREQRGKWAYFTLIEEAVEKLAAVADLKGALSR